MKGLVGGPLLVGGQAWSPPPPLKSGPVTIETMFDAVCVWSRSVIGRCCWCCTRSIHRWNSTHNSRSLHEEVCLLNFSTLLTLIVTVVFCSSVTYRRDIFLPHPVATVDNARDGVT